MLGSLKIGTLAGIPIRLHLSLVVVVALLLAQLGWIGFPASLVLFGSLLAHELGHAVLAQRFGIPISSIDLHILGGLARLTRPPRTATQELLVAAAGPAVSLVLGAVLTGLALLFGARLEVAAIRPVDLLALGAALNILMGLFNLLPALPMDGGRMFRAALTPRFGHVGATRVAAWVSRGFGAAFVVAGLFSGHWGVAVVGALLFLLVSHEVRAAPVVDEYQRHGDRVFERPPPEPHDPRHLAQGGRPRGPETVVDVTGGRVGETREEYVDGYGRRYVIVTEAIET